MAKGQTFLGEEEKSSKGPIRHLQDDVETDGETSE
jgi:hypothetical protein